MLSQLIERLKKTWRRQMSVSMLLTGSALLSGCAALGVDQSNQPVMVSEVIRMSKENVPAETIVNKMRALESRLSPERGAVSPVARPGCCRSRA